MKRNVLRKLRSNEGASLTFAILLFLVCAVIGTIVLTAGTIASGRLAEKAEMDQRYYHVVSSAEFIKDTLDNRKVVILRDKVADSLEVQGYVYGEGGSHAEYDFITARTIELLESNAWDADFFDTTSKLSQYKLQITGYDEFKPVINAEVVDGKMFLDIADNEYKVRMTFFPKISEVVEKTDSSEIKISTVTWTVSSIEKVFE